MTDLTQTSIQKERLGLAITALVLAIFAILLTTPFLFFVLFPPQPTPGTEEALGGYVLATIGFLLSLFLLVPSTVLSLIFSIIALVKSRQLARTLGRVALIVAVVAFIVTVFLIAKILLPFWFYHSVS